MTRPPPPATGAALARNVVAALAPHADPRRAVPMAAYMRDRFAFLGIATPLRRSLTRPLAAEVRRGIPARPLLAAARALWRLPQREYQYAAVDLLVAGVRSLSASALPAVAELIRARSGWDTVDALASNVVGPIVRATPAAATTMDAWSRDADPWLRRAAILHQLRAGAATDAPRLFAYCRANAGDPDFFVRKGIGWALRQYAYADPAAVRAFLAAHRTALSPLSLREAARRLGAPAGADRR